MVKVMYYFLQKWIGPHFWRLFKQAHLVTLSNLIFMAMILQLRKWAQTEKAFIFLLQNSNDVRCCQGDQIGRSFSLVQILRLEFF
jgi:hypothetical protein